MNSRPDDELRDELPADLNAVEHGGAYRFPDNSRRRIPGLLDLLLAAGCLAVWGAGGDSPVVNSGLVLAAVILVVRGDTLDVRAAEALMKKSRPRIHLTPAQARAAEAAVEMLVPSTSASRSE
jgi:hypothetical protein